jgi:simple sugar transport system ATP-binding protein
MAVALEMRNITKYFPSSEVLANKDVSLSIEAGEIHALVGENGAGKTTLMNIVYGLVKPDSGEIVIDGQPVSIGHPDDAIRHGIGMVHQHFKLVASFTVAQNIMLGMEPNTLGFLRQRDENEAVRQLADRYGLPVDPTIRIRDLPVGMQQRVEILKVLERQAKILILDEPTAVLTPQEVNELIAIVRRLAERGYTIVFITHKLLEVIRVADRVSVMRQGQMVGTKKVAETDIPELARMMVGREVLLRVNKDEAKPGEVVFEANDISVASSNGLAAVSRLSFQVREGEILGVAGVSGNGQTELVEALTGMRPVDGGALRFLGKEITGLNVRGRRNLGMAHIPEDRIRVGLNLHTNLDENVIVSSYRKRPYNRLGFMQRRPIREFAGEIVRRFSIASARPGGGISTLSGGNMQKVVVGRELTGKPKFIIANQPTRGLDVGSIEFVHRTLIEAREQGAGILLVSVELEEILSLSDRVVVLYRGQIQGEVDPKTTTEEEVGILMAGGSLGDAQAAAAAPQAPERHT